MSDDFFVHDEYDDDGNEQEYKKYNDGVYKVSKFDWSNKDEETGNPIIKSKDGYPILYIQLLSEGETDGPPMSLSLGNFNLLLMAKDESFGYVTVPQMNEAGKVIDFLLDKQSKFNNSPIEVEMVVDKGWVDRVKNMPIPKGSLYFYCLGPSSKKEAEPAPLEGKFGPFFYVNYMVVAGEGKQPSMYDNCVFTESMNYPLKSVNGKAKFERKKDGKPTKGSFQLSTLIKLTAPEIDGNFSPPDPNNVLPYWSESAKKSRIILSGLRSKDDKGNYKIDFIDLSVAEGFESQVEEDEDTKARSILCDVISYLANGDPVPLDGSNYSDDVVGIMKTYLSPLKAEGRIPGKLKQFTFDNCLVVMEVIKKHRSTLEFVSDSYGKLTELGIKVNQGVSEWARDFPEVDESPF